MKGISQAVEVRVRETFSADDAELVLLALSEMERPPLTPEFESLRDRVQFAVLLLSNGDPNSLLKQVRSSQIDWRDTLVAAGVLEERLRK